LRTENEDWKRRRGLADFAAHVLARRPWQTQVQHEHGRCRRPKHFQTRCAISRNIDRKTFRFEQSLESFCTARSSSITRMRSEVAGTASIVVVAEDTLLVTTTPAA